MDFEELKKIWDTQNNKPMYVIDESMIHRKVVDKKKKAAFRTNFAEFVGIGANLFSASLIGSAMIYKEKDSLFPALMMVAMFIAAIVIFISRMRRVRNEKTSDRSTLGELEHALHNAVYHVRLNTGLLWFFGLVVVLTMGTLLSSDKSLWMIPAVTVFFGIVAYGARWEHRCYVGKKRELENMMAKIKEEPEEG